MFMFAAKNYIDQEESNSLLALPDTQTSFTVLLEGLDSKGPHTSTKAYCMFPPSN